MVREIEDDVLADDDVYDVERVILRGEATETDTECGIWGEGQEIVAEAKTEMEGRKPRPDEATIFRLTEIITVRQRQKADFEIKQINQDLQEDIKKLTRKTRRQREAYIQGVQTNTLLISPLPIFILAMIVLFLEVRKSREVIDPERTST